MDNTLDAEWVASRVVAFWGDETLHRRGSFEMPAELELVAAFEEIGGTAAVVMLRALAFVAGGQVGPAAAEAAARLTSKGVLVPSWVEYIGSATPTEAWALRDDHYDDGIGLLVEFSMPDRAPHVLSVYVDHNLGGIAKIIGLCRSKAEMESPDLPLEPIGLSEAGARLRAALDAVPLALRMGRACEAAELHALARARALALPQVMDWPDPPEPDADERFDLMTAFLESPEGAQFHQDVGAQSLVALAIDFCADWVDGRPLRWSPTVVEMFVGDWLPFEADESAAVLERVGDVLPAWIAYAGRRRGVPAEKVEETVAAIAECRSEAVYGGASSAA